MKIAMCYSGAVRGLLNNLEHVISVLFPDKENHEIDFYLYADRNGGTIHQKDIDSGNIEPQGLKVQNERADFNCKLVNELDGFPERMEKFKKKIVNYHMPFKEQVHQWYSVQQVFNFVFEQEKEYDVYVRMRCDLFPAGIMKFDWSGFEQNKVYVPFNAPFGGINDRFGFGSKEAMRVYSNFYDSEIYYNVSNLDSETVAKGKAFYEKYYSHIATDNYRNGRDNSEFRLLSYLHQNEIEIEVLPGEELHIGSVRDSDGLIRYPGPDLEQKLIKYNNLDIKDLKYDRLWWR